MQKKKFFGLKKNLKKKKNSPVCKKKKCSNKTISVDRKCLKKIHIRKVYCKECIQKIRLTS